MATTATTNISLDAPNEFRQAANLGPAPAVGEGGGVEVGVGVRVLYLGWGRDFD